MPLNRRQVRKEKRKAIKEKRNEYHSSKVHCNKKFTIKEMNVITTKVKSLEAVKKVAAIKNIKNKSFDGKKVLSIEEIHKKEKKQQNTIQVDMLKQRKDQLLMENLTEDQTIKKMEKKLKLHKRKSKHIPKSFTADGLDYLLQVCDSEFMKNVASAEQDLNEGRENFEEDFNLMSGAKIDEVKYSNSENSYKMESKEEISSSDEDSSENERNLRFIIKRKASICEADVPLKKQKNEHPGLTETSLVAENDVNEQTWEDIYGRLRSKNGSILENTDSKYIPPAIRAQVEKLDANNTIQNEKLCRLKKQLKGLLNRLAESNMYSIANQVEQLYMKNSRNDMNQSLTYLISDALIGSVLTHERLLIEHVLLITILHANVGIETGAYFLQDMAKKFNNYLNLIQDVEDKHLDNTVNILAQLYNFKVYDGKLLYEILEKLSKSFTEKNVDCILSILRTVGFSLRKDDPLELKNLILVLQKQAMNNCETNVNNSRVKFLLDVLLAIKNNNVTKIPNYDVSYSEHLKKIMKGFIRKGNYVSPLSISLEDLLNADKNGKWWVIGSAWSGKSKDVLENKNSAIKSDAYSEKLLDLARKQRMNTDTRRDIFCILMSAEDYLDAFEKLLKLGLKNQQEREIIPVLLHCCLQEKPFNSYYAVLAQKLCEHDRKFQITIKYSVWDKLKTLNSHSGLQIFNLAKLLIHLFINKGLPISTLKILEFSDLDKISLRLIRQILLGILLHDDLEVIQQVFSKIALSDKLKIFRDSLRLFIHHFLLKNLKDDVVTKAQKQNLEIRVKIVEKVLTVKELKRNWLN